MTGQGISNPAGASPRPSWLWPIRPGLRLIGQIDRALDWISSIMRGPRAFLFAFAAGTLPLAVSFATGLPGHQWITGTLLVPLLLCAVRSDRFPAGVSMLLAALLGHSVLAITLAHADPVRASLIMPRGAEYLRDQMTWIRTGKDPEYELANWLPAHGQLIGAMALFTFISFGWMSLVEGVKELDLMNYYVGCLLRESRDPSVALLAGWHVWSILRGIGFAILIFEIASWSFARFSARPSSTPGRRTFRWALALAFLAADALVKYFALPVVREILAANLRR